MMTPVVALRDNFVGSVMDDNKKKVSVFKQMGQMFGAPSGMPRASRND